MDEGGRGRDGMGGKIRARWNGWMGREGMGCDDLCIYDRICTFGLDRIGMKWNESYLSMNEFHGWVLSLYRREVVRGGDVKSCRDVMPSEQNGLIDAVYVSSLTLLHPYLHNSWDSFHRLPIVDSIHSK